MPLAERRDNPLRRAGVHKKGDTLFLKREYPPLDPREKGRGALPLVPAYIGSLWLEELHALRNQMRCTWLRHESLLLVTARNRALLS